MHNLHPGVPAGSVAVYCKSPIAHFPKALRCNAGVSCPLALERAAVCSKSSMEDCPAAVRWCAVGVAMSIIPFHCSISPGTVARFWGSSTTLPRGSAAVYVERFHHPLTPGTVAV